MLIMIFECFSCQLHNTIITYLFRLWKKAHVHIFVLIHFFFCCTFLHDNLRINFSEVGLIEFIQDLAQSRQNNKYCRLHTVQVGKGRDKWQVLEWQYTQALKKSFSHLLTPPLPSATDDDFIKSKQIILLRQIRMIIKSF